MPSKFTTCPQLALDLKEQAADKVSLFYAQCSVKFGMQKWHDQIKSWAMTCFQNVYKSPMKWATQIAAMKYACYPTYHAIKVKHIVHD